MGVKKISRITELWRDKNGFAKVVFYENTHNIEGNSNLYLEIGGSGMIIHIKILINDMIEFLNEWSESRKSND